MAAYYHLNGKLIPTDRPGIHVHDLGLMRGYGVFDYFVFNNRQPRFLDDYLNRFYHSARTMRLVVPVDRLYLAKAIAKLIDVNEANDGGIHLLLTGGYTTDRYTPTRPNLIIQLYPYPEVPDRHYREGVTLASLTYKRDLPEVKSTNYLTGIHRQPWLEEQGADFLLYIDTYVRESDRSNFFIIDADGQLRTAANHILKGITRQKVLELAPAILPVVVENYTLADVYLAREAFLTSSTKGVMPVVAVDGRMIGNGGPGPLTQQLGRAFAQLIG